MNRLSIVAPSARAYRHDRGRAGCPITATLSATDGRATPPLSDRSFRDRKGITPSGRLFTGVIRAEAAIRRPQRMFGQEDIRPLWFLDPARPDIP